MNKQPLSEKEAYNLILVHLSIISKELKRNSDRITNLSLQVSDLYKRIDKADQFLEQSRITDAKVDRLLAFEYHKTT